MISFGILRILIGIFCGTLIGIFAGGLNGIVVSLFRYPFAASMLDIIIWACIGASFGFCVGVFSGLIARGWRTSLLVGFVASVAATGWLISMNWQSEWDGLDFRPPTLILTAVIWLAAGWLTALAVRSMFEEIRSNPRGSGAVGYYCALGIFYLLLGGYLLFWFFSYLEYRRQYGDGVGQIGIERQYWRRTGRDLT